MKHHSQRGYRLADFVRAVASHYTTLDIAEHLGCAESTVRKYLERAELLGYVEMTRNGHALIVELTSEGRKTLT